MKCSVLAAAAVLLGACASAPVEPLRATAQLQPTKGSKTFGEATFEEADGKIHVVVYVQGLKPGQEHGLHIHEAGDCSSARRDIFSLTQAWYRSFQTAPASNLFLPGARYRLPRESLLL